MSKKGPGDSLSRVLTSFPSPGLNHQDLILILDPDIVQVMAQDFTEMERRVLEVLSNKPPKSFHHYSDLTVEISFGMSVNEMADEDDPQFPSDDKYYATERAVQSLVLAGRLVQDNDTCEVSLIPRYTEKMALTPNTITTLSQTIGKRRIAAAA